MTILGLPLGHAMPDAGPVEPVGAVSVEGLDAPTTQQPMTAEGPLPEFHYFGGGTGMASVCRDELLGGCPSLRSDVTLTGELTGCERTGGTLRDPVFSCDVHFEMALFIAGADTGCAEGLSTPTPFLIGCIFVPGFPYKSLDPQKGDVTYDDIGVGRNERYEEVQSCIDILLVFQRCSDPVVVTIYITIESPAANIDLGIVEDAIEAVEEAIEDLPHTEIPPP